METDKVPPGFTLLSCLKLDYRNLQIYKSLVWRGNDVFISSQIARESHLKGNMTFIHGPCQSGNIMGFDFDCAYTLKCPIWPIEANSFIYRSLIQGWPPVDILQEIYQDECLLVPIGSRSQSFMESTYLEWRISFSYAERKLVHSMSHCQFLCYGLLKIFLNEVLKQLPQTGELLCSYFFKTAVFWEISEGQNIWSPRTFILNVWNTFRRIMKWVSVGYCPNFFIPEHNMFYGKIFGRQQRNLLSDLRALYNEGYLCFLRCASMNQSLYLIINNPVSVNNISINENDYVSLKEIEVLKLRKAMVYFSVISTYDVISLINTLCNIKSLVPASDEMLSAVKLTINDILQRIASVILSNRDRNLFSSNKSQFRSIKAAKLILRRSKTFFCLNWIRRAVWSYMQGNYIETIKLVGKIKQRFREEPYMHHCSLDCDIIMDRRQQGMSYDEIVNKYVTREYVCDPDLSIEELYLESHINKQMTGGSDLFIPPVIFLNLLLILSYTRLSEHDSRFEVLRELESLLRRGNPVRYQYLFKAISWEILGICQQLCGEYHGAYQSYLNALNDKYNYFKYATIIRMNSLSL